MTPLITAKAAWDLLHHECPRLCEEATLDFSGFLRPGLTIKAEIIRADVRVALTFELIRGGTIAYIQKVIPNMAPWCDFHGHWSSFDKSIPPF
jgi:hypothetical protein